MGKRKITENSRLNLLVPLELKQRFEAEAEFLHLGSHIAVIGDEDQRELKSKADLIRWAVELYCAAVEMGETFPEIDRLKTETAPLAFCMTSQDRGLWDYAIKHHYASTIHDLATLALWRYFSRIDEALDGDEATYKNLAAMSSIDIISSIRGGTLRVPSAR